MNNRPKTAVRAETCVYGPHSRQAFWPQTWDDLPPGWPQTWDDLPPGVQAHFRLLAKAMIEAWLEAGDVS